MPTVQLKHVISFSSQDPKHPAENVLKPVSNLSWLSAPNDRSGKLEGIFQLNKSCFISHLDIGTYMALTVEVLVGRSSWSQDQAYKTLIPACTLLTPAESKKGTNKHSVKLFNKGDFHSETRDESWDRIKVVCIQPFRKDLQFGLCFVKIVTPDSPSKVPLPSQGVSHSQEAKVRGGNSSATSLIKNHFYGGGSSRGTDSSAASSRWSRSGQMVYAAASNTPKYKTTLDSGVASTTQQAYNSNKTFEEEVLTFLRKQNIQLSDLDTVTFADLRHRLEKQKCRKLSPEEKTTFSDITNDHIAHQLDKQDNKQDRVTPSRPTPSRPTPSRPTPSRPTPSQPDDSIVSLADDASTVEDESEVSFNSRLHPSMEGKRKSNSVEIFRNSDFDLHATVNGSPIKVLGAKNNIVSQKSTARKIFSFKRKESNGHSVLNNSTTETSVRDLYKKDDDRSSSPLNFNKNMTKETSAKKEPLKFMKLTPTSNKYKNSLHFKRSTPSPSNMNRSDSCLPDLSLNNMDTTPSRRSKSLGYTPQTVRNSKRKLIDDDNSDNTTNDVWLSAGTPPPKSKKTRHSDIISLSETGEIDETEGSGEDQPQCPICMGYFPASELEEHGALCARLAFGDGRSRIPETPPCGSVQNKAISLSDPETDTTEVMVECPICSNVYLESKISAHANMCADGAFS